MNELSEKELKLIKESGFWLSNWINNLYLKVKAKDDPYGNQMREIISKLKETVDDIDSSLYDLSGSSDNIAKQLSVFTVFRTIRSKMTASVNVIDLKIVPVMCTRKIHEQVGINKDTKIPRENLYPSSFLTFDKKKEVNEEAEEVISEDEKSKEKVESVSAPEISIGGKARKGSSYTFDSLKEDLVILKEVLEGLEIINKAYTHITNIIVLKEDENKNELMVTVSLTGSDKTYPLKALVAKANIGSKALASSSNILIKDIENCITNEETNELKRLRRRFINIIYKYKVCATMYKIICSFLKKDNEIINIPEVKLNDDSEKSEAEKATEEEKRSLAFHIPANIIIKGTSYNDILVGFIAKYSRDIGLYEKLVTHLQETGQNIGAMFYERTQRLIKIRQILKEIKLKIIEMITLVKNLLGSTIGAEDEIRRINELLNAYNEFTEYFNVAVSTEVQPAINSLVQEAREGGSEKAYSTIRSALGPDPDNAVKDIKLFRYPRVEQLIVFKLNGQNWKERTETPAARRKEQPLSIFQEGE